MNDRYDLAVIGAGSAGLSAASFAARLGARVALVERARVGGECTWTGCVPSKALLHAAKVVHQMQAATALGPRLAVTEVDLRRVMAQVQAVIQRVYRFETPEVLAEEGLDVVHGPACFLNAHTIDVDGRALRSRRFVICTGARPIIPPIPGLANTPHLTYETVFQLATLPPSLLVLGGGPVGVELAQAFQRLGSAVTLIEQAGGLVPTADPDASAALAERLRDEGMRVRLGATVERIETHDSSVTAVMPKETCAGDALLVAAGRRPDLAGLGLDRAGVAHGPQGILVDDHLRTSESHIYACGDVIGSFQFTHYAAWQGFVAVRNALLPGNMRGTRPTVPWVVFTDPEVAQVGLTEAQARERSDRVHVQRWPVERIDRAQTAGEQTGFLKLITRPDGKLVGATVVASAASELVNELALAVERGLTLRDLAATVHAYPTYSFGIQQASAEATYSQLTSGWRGRLLSVLARRWP